MEHSLRVEYPGQPRPAEMISSSLVEYGEPDGTTCMSRTVGLTAAIGIHRVLEQPTASTPQLIGVLRPTMKSVYEYCLPRLAAEGLKFEETRRACSEDNAGVVRVVIPESCSSASER